MGQKPFSFHRIPVGIDNCYLLCGRKNILIDAGAPGHLNEFAEGMCQVGVEPKSIELIILTHGHADHIGCLHCIQKLTGAKVAVHKNDRNWVETGCPPLPPGTTKWGRTIIGLGKVFYKPRIVPCKVDYVLDRDQSLMDFGIPARIIHLPGHTMGSVGVLLDTGVVFAGDMAMNSWFLRSTPGLPVLAEDMKMVVESWKKLIKLGAKHVYPAHGFDFPVVTIQKEIA